MLENVKATRRCLYWGLRLQLTNTFCILHIVCRVCVCVCVCVCTVFFYEMIIQVWPQEEMKEILRKNQNKAKFIIFTGPGTGAGPCGKDPGEVKLEKAGRGRQRSGHGLYWGFLGRGKAGWMHSLG